ncbi:MAG: sugar phosphate isomerase/epimerase [Clostridiales bacterium]|nr:sugar phosphate isomerase/epimerase [Clostridiales bacterium]
MRLGGSVMPPYHSPKEWLALVKELQYSAVIFPVHWSAPRAVRQEYLSCIRDNDLAIGEVGIWKNLFAPDDAQRKAALEDSFRCLELAEEVGANCCVNICGTPAEIWDGFHPLNYARETYERIVEISRRIIDTVQPEKTSYTLEPMPWMCPRSPEEYLQLIRDVDRPAFRAHLDYCNMISSADRYADAEGFIEKCFALLSPYIRSIHAKDILIDDHILPLCIQEVPPGKGSMPLGMVLQLSHHLGEDATVFVEHLPDHESYLAAIDHMRKVGEAAGVPIK